MEALVNAFALCTSNFKHMRTRAPAHAHTQARAHTFSRLLSLSPPSTLILCLRSCNQAHTAMTFLLPPPSPWPATNPNNIFPVRRLKPFSHYPPSQGLGNSSQPTFSPEGAHSVVAGEAKQLAAKEGNACGVRGALEHGPEHPPCDKIYHDGGLRVHHDHQLLHYPEGCCEA